MYTRRQLRVQYAIGGARQRYYEETLYGKLEETRAQQRLSATFEQREPWGTLEGRVEASNYFPGLSTHRLEIDGEADLQDESAATILRCTTMAPLASHDATR